jgi:hypothetical protein
VRASSSGRHTRRKAVGRSRNRGCKGHWILRRVLVGGRHLRLSRAIFLHGKVVTAALAASSRGRGDTARKSQSYEGDAKALRVLRKRERRQRCQRLDRLAGTVGRKRPRSEPPRRRHPARGFEARQRVSAAIRRSVLECRETLGPLVINRTEPKTPWGVHAMKVAERARNSRGTGTRRSYRWQKSVGRIARLVLRKIARSCGEPGR